MWCFTVPQAIFGAAYNITSSPESERGRKGGGTAPREQSRGSPQSPTVLGRRSARRYRFVHAFYCNVMAYHPWNDPMQSLRQPRCVLALTSSFLLAGDHNGSSALMWASSRQKVEIVEALLAAGADPNLRNIFGWSALEYNLERTGSFYRSEKAIKVRKLLFAAGSSASSFAGLTLSWLSPPCLYVDNYSYLILFL